MEPDAVLTRRGLDGLVYQAPTLAHAPQPKGDR